MKYIVMILMCMAPLAYKHIQNYFSAREIQEHLLQQKWKTARENRLQWKKEHRLYFNFEDPEYRRLWHIEIGSEDYYLLHINGRGVSISWPDYKYEEEDFERRFS